MLSGGTLLLADGGDDDDDTPLDLGQILRGPDGSLRLDRAWRAIRGRGTTDRDLLPYLAVFLVTGPPAGVAYAVYEAAATTPLEGAALGLLYAVVMMAIVGLNRVMNRYGDDPDVAAEVLQRRYAEGEIDRATFERQIELVMDEGAEVLADDDGEDEDVPDSPEAILRRRYAEGEIDQAEYERRMATLQGSTPAATADEQLERETERE